VRQLLVTASVVPSSLILVTLMKEALSSSETSVLQEPHGFNIPEDTFLHDVTGMHHVKVLHVHTLLFLGLNLYHLQ
jgi:hypothetical protein